MPKGKLIPIGGAEDKRYDMLILKRIVEEIGKDNITLEVITTATVESRQVGNRYCRRFKELGATHCGTLNINSRRRAEEHEYIDRICKANAVFITGGDQSRLRDFLNGTGVHKELLRRYDSEEFIIAGTSAGAAAMSDVMMQGGSSEEALSKGELILTTGLSFIKNMVIDTHFTQRGRFARLIEAIATSSSRIGLGFGEDTGAVITNGNELEIIGSGMVVIMDGSTVKFSNINQARKGDPLSISGITMHVLSKGDKFYINERNFIQAS